MVLAVVVAGLVVGGFEVRINKNMRPAARAPPHRQTLVGGRGTIINAIRMPTFIYADAIVSRRTIPPCPPNPSLPGDEPNV